MPPQQIAAPSYITAGGIIFSVGEGRAGALAAPRTPVYARAMATSLRHVRARVLKALFAFHRELYERSDGRIGAWAGMPTLLLSTKGRKTGILRTTPLVYFGDGAAYVVVGSDGGARRDPQWWRNLEVDPIARVRVGRRVFEARARLAVGEERARLWERGRAINPMWAQYQAHTSRELPVVVLEATTVGA